MKRMNWLGLMAWGGAGENSKNLFLQENQYRISFKCNFNKYQSSFLAESWYRNLLRNFRSFDEVERAEVNLFNWNWMSNLFIVEHTVYRLSAEYHLGFSAAALISRWSPSMAYV